MRDVRCEWVMSPPGVRARLNSPNRPNDRAGIAIFYEHIEEKLAKTVIYIGFLDIW